MDWRKLKVGQVIWYVNKSGPDRLSGPCLELWKGTVISIDPKCVHPVCCEWDRVGGQANWVRPEYGWYKVIFRGQRYHTHTAEHNERNFDMTTECPNCGHVLQNPTGIAIFKDDLLGLHLECPACEEHFAVWFKGKLLGRTTDDCIATVPCTFFYPAEGETEQSMKAAGVQDSYPFKKGS